MLALVVEDDRDQRELMCEFLTCSGWRVELAEDGVAGLGRVPQLRPDLILLDLNMPRLDGVGLLKMLRSTRPGRTVPVVVTTGADVTDEVRTLADAVLVKPFDREALLQTLSGVALATAVRRKGPEPPP